jgi:hypothetical protein
MEDSAKFIVLRELSSHPQKTKEKAYMLNVTDDICKGRNKATLGNSPFVLQYNEQNYYYYYYYYYYGHYGIVFRNDSR